MDEEQLQKMAGDPRFISGIDNYCDRWCERCRFTGQCLNYAIGREEFAGKDEQEQWQALGRLMRQTADMVRKNVEEQNTAEEEAVGEDIEEEDFERDESFQEYIEAQEWLDRQVDQEPCCICAREYMETARAWFNGAGQVFDMEREGITKALRLELPQTDPEQTAHVLNDAIKTIRWYEPQICAKLRRASRGIIRADEGADYAIDDANGSAKVALIGIDRSICAWEMLYHTLGDGQDGILDILAQLQRLRRMAEEAFPDARGFVRPGLDELPADAT